MPSHQGKSGTSAGVAQGTSSSGGNGRDYGPYSKGPTHQPSQKTTTRNGKKDHTGKVISALGYATNINPLKAFGTAVTWGKSLFQKTPEQKRASYTKKGLDITNPAEMHGYQTKYGKIDEDTYTGGEGIGNITTHTQSLVTAPTADKGAGFGHQWNFQAYGNQTQTAANPYDYTKAPYAKKGKMIRTYATGQEIKNFSKGKRFGPPPLKGPNPQGLQVILENSDYFKKLIG